MEYQVLHLHSLRVNTYPGEMKWIAKSSTQQANLLDTGKPKTLTKPPGQQWLFRTFKANKTPKRKWRAYKYQQSKCRDDQQWQKKLTEVRMIIWLLQLLALIHILLLIKSQPEHLAERQSWRQPFLPCFFFFFPFLWSFGCAEKHVGL